ncbi:MULTISPECIES: response regulator transcription factor [Streptomyces]|uniref:LuxR C-terminal-related transcriptional regulator n=1 Tax=Streptomyces flaveolus TaxID=67297 RepID=A0ABV3ANY4_9ACTN|nr:MULTISPECIES: LuxR C-terminal-related transcriptional regulator [unclassified Streptomyces]
MRILIADGSAVLRAGLAQVLRDGGHEVAAVLAGPSALPAAAVRCRPDAVLAGLRPADADAVVDAVLEAGRALPGLASLLHCAAPTPALAARLFGARRSGTALLLHDQVVEAEVLLPTLERIAAGGTVADPRATGVLAAAFPAAPNAGAGAGPTVWDDPGLSELSPRERDVLRLMALGRTNSAIATDLCVSPGTVEKRVAAVFTKLGLNGGDGENRRVLAVLRLLSAEDPATMAPPPPTRAPAEPVPLSAGRRRLSPAPRTRVA